MSIEKDNYNAWIIWILGASFFFLEYIVRVSPGVMAQQLVHDFNITAYGLGTLSAFFYYSYIVMQVPVGTLVDKYSVRWLVGSMALLCAGSSFLFASTRFFSLAELSRLLIGVTGAFAFVGALKLASVWFSPKRFGFLAGTTQALGMLGAAMGAGPLSILVTHIGWRSSLFFLGTLIAILAILIFWIVRDAPRTEAYSKESEKNTVLQGLKLVFKNPMTWINGVIVGLLYAPTEAFGELWGPSYIQSVYGNSAAQAASLVSLIFIGWAIGSPLFGWVSDTIKRRKPIILGSAAFSLLFILILLYMPFLPISVLFIVAFLYGLSNVGVSTCYAVACEIVPAECAGTSLGFTNMASILLGGAFQPIIGWFLDLVWDGNVVNGVRQYSAHDFKIAMLALPICLALCLIFCFFFKESYGGRIAIKKPITIRGFSTKKSKQNQAFEIT